MDAEDFADFETITWEVRGAVGIVTLDRPEMLNAFNLKMQRELRTLWRALRDDDQVNAIVLTGAGEKAFCSGIDREESIQQGYLQNPDSPRPTGRTSTPFMYNDPGTDLNPKANDMWKPVIAAVNGMACGGALYLLGEADIVIAVDHATFFDPHVSYGMVSGFESVHLLQKLPLGETLRVQLMGAHERMSAERAHTLGLVSEVVAPEVLMERAMWVAESVASAPTMAVQGTMRAIWMAHEQARQVALSQVSTLVSLGTEYENIEAGQAAFRDGKPQWRLR
ncbi:MAG: enoyl-CoA hydratase/isomerase family protein [Microthrixaceae bacterium]